MKEVKGELIGVQYLRGLAALLVVIYHAASMAALEKYFGVMVAPDITRWGFIGVDLFFVISGFIIVYSSLNTELNAKINIRNYIKKRFIRIFPFLWVCVIGYALLKWLGKGEFDYEPYIRSLFLFPIGEIKPNVVWTLRHELLFYIMFIFILLSKRVGLSLICIWILSSVIAYCMSIKLNELFAFLISPINLLFGYGMLGAIIYLKGGIRLFFINKPIFVLFLITVGIIFLAIILDYNRENILDVVFMGSFFAFIVLVSTHFHSSGKNIGRLVGVLGNASYAIYLTHEAFISAMLIFFSKIFPSANISVVVILLIAISVFCGIIVHYFVERPIISWFRKIL